MQTITVDMTPGFRQPTIHYSQNDVGTTFAIDLRSRFGDTLPASPTVKIQATKPSGFGFSIEADSVVDSVATFTTVATMTDEAGRFLAELEVSDSGVVLYTANFYMEGEANPHPIGTTDGSQETVIPTLTLLVERVEAAASSVLDMTVNATTLAAGSQATYSYDEATNTATFGIPQGEAGAGAAGVTASAYSASRTYAVGDYVIHNNNLYRCTMAITTAEAFTAAHWTQVVLGDDVCDLNELLNKGIEGLKSSVLTPDVIWEFGYINPSDGAEKPGAYNTRTKNILHFNKDDCIIKLSNCTASFAYYSSEGVYQSITLNPSFSAQGVFIFPSEAYVRIVFSYSPQSVISDVDSANDYLSVIQLYDYDRLDNAEFALSSPFESYSRKVAERYGPANLPITTIKGHKYIARFKTSSALTLNSFYLQIWQTQDITDPSTCIKNFGNVWGSQDTSKWLEYEFIADGIYDGYFRFGYDTSPVPSNVIAIGELYDVTSNTLIHVNDLFDEVSKIEKDSTYWKGKKIVWFGTSIPAGVVNAGDSGGNGAYPTRLGEMLGATVYNESVGSSQVRAGSYHNITADDPMGYGGCSAVSLLYSLSLSSSEKQDIIDNWNSKWSSIITWFGSLVDLSKANEYKASSWDVKLTKYLTGGSVGQCDLYVFDHGYNDGIYQRGFTDLSDVPANAEDRTYFLGAMQFLIDKILADNPKAKILFIGHYCTDGRSGNFLTKYVTDAQEKLAEIWQYPLIETWKYMGFNHVPITVDNVQTTVAQQWMPDDIHPSSDTTGEALKHYAEVLYPLIRDVR